MTLALDSAGAPLARASLALLAAALAACGAVPDAPAPADPPVAARAAALLGDGSPVALRNAASGLCLDIFGASQDSLSPAIVWGCAFAPNQSFTLTPPAGDAPSYQLVAQHSGKCLDVYGAFPTAGTAAMQYGCHGGANQRFTLQPSGAGYQLVAQHSGLCLAPDGRSAGAAVRQQPCTGGADHTWTPVANGCLAVPNGCDANATCAPDGAGAAVCRCRPGYCGDGRSCTPVSTVGVLVNNGGAYAAGWELWYDGQRYAMPSIGGGGRGAAQVPYGASDLRLRVWALGGGDVLDLRWSSATSTHAYRVGGTTLVPSYDEEGRPRSYCL